MSEGESLTGTQIYEIAKRNIHTIKCPVCSATGFTVIVDNLNNNVAMFCTKCFSGTTVLKCSDRRVIKSRRS